MEDPCFFVGENSGSGAKSTRSYRNHIRSPGPPHNMLMASGRFSKKSCLPCLTLNFIFYFSYLYEVITLCRNRTLTPEMEEEVADMLVYYPPRTLVYRYVPCRGLSADVLFQIRNGLIQIRIFRILLFFSVAFQDCNKNKFFFLRIFWMSVLIRYLYISLLR
jgi:hypothetical protein